MAYSISCPNCRQAMEAPEDSRGGEIRCPECGSLFVEGAQTDITELRPRPTGSAATDVKPGPPPSRRPIFPDAGNGVDLSYRVDLGSGFRPGGGLALAVTWLLAVNLLFSLGMLGSDFLQYDLALRLMAGRAVPEAELQGNDDRQGLLGLVYLVLFIATAIVFVVWFHRAHSNLTQLGARELQYTSGWAVGCWFVPFLNLWRPVQIAQEIWRNSDPGAIDDQKVQLETSSNSALIGFWWAAWIISNVIANFAIRMAWEVRSPETLKSATVADMVSQAVSIIAAGLALAVVSRIDGRQTARAEALSLG